MTPPPHSKNTLKYIFVPADNNPEKVGILQEHADRILLQYINIVGELKEDDLKSLNATSINKFLWEYEERNGLVIYFNTLVEYPESTFVKSEVFLLPLSIEDKVTTCLNGQIYTWSILSMYPITCIYTWGGGVTLHDRC